MGKCDADWARARFRCLFLASRCSSPLTSTRPLRRQQSTPQQTQVRQRKCGIQPPSVLGQAAVVANLAEAPQALDHMEGMLDTGPGRGTPAVDEPLVLAQRPASRAPIDPIMDAERQRTLTMPFVPVGLNVEHLSLLTRAATWTSACFRARSPRSCSDYGQ
jgi:hypothetical protein